MSLASLRLTANVRSVVPLSPSRVVGESMDSVGRALMVTFTVSVSLSPSAVTVSVKVSVTSSATSGAVKLASLPAAVNETVGLPPV